MAASPGQQALAVIDLARNDRFEELRGQFAPVLRRLVSANVLRTAWKTETTRWGPLRSVGEPVAESARAGVVAVRLPLSFERGTLTLVVSVSRGRLLGIRVVPSDAARLDAEWDPPPYAAADAFIEQEHTIGAGPAAVTATLTLPCGDGLWPAAVLLAGSGPQDRDETIGANKPLKDLAWGLASRGIAVARFDKITFAHPAHLATIDAVPIVDEYVPQTLAAINVIGAQAEVDAHRTVRSATASAEPLCRGSRRRARTGRNSAACRERAAIALGDRPPIAVSRLPGWRHSRRVT